MKKYIVAGAAFLLPAMAFAQTFPYITSVLNFIQGFVKSATPVVVGLAVLFFLYGLMKFILAAGNEDAKDEGKRIMIWGVIALFVMVSVWGLVTLLQTNLGVTAGAAPGNIGGLVP
jgi:uncharacterized membrane protein YidH (DUF202 family)